jgi:hypothetical protein
MLASGLSQTTTNLIASCLDVHPRLVMPEHFASAYRHYYGAPPSTVLVDGAPAMSRSTSVDFADVKDDEMVKQTGDWTDVQAGNLFIPQ